MDTDLVVRAQHGDEEAFASLAVAVGGRLHAVAHRILRDIELAEDATQQALLTIWRDLPQLRDPARFDAWSYRVLSTRAMPTDGREPPTSISRQSILASTEGLSTVVDRDQLERGFRRCPSTIARWWSSTTTPTCRSTRSPRSSASRSGRSDPVYFTRCVGYARPSRPMRGPLCGRLRNEHRS
jgi:hypothetical protein